jgi:hypothetical protein
MKVDPKTNPFIDPKEFRQFVDAAEHDFEAELKQQQPQK